MAERHKDTSRPESGYGSGFYEWVHIFFVAIVVAGVLNCFFGIINVKQESMMPTVHDGDRICLNRAAYWFSKPKTGDIIIFYDTNTDMNYVKRVIGTPGDAVEIKKGVVYVNGNRLNEPYINEPSAEDMYIEIPEGKYFCLGDNRAISIDSRDESIGCISEDKILGKVTYSLSELKKLN